MHRMKRLPLRSRLALLSALAVAVAIAGVAAVSWFAVRDRLYSQVDKSIEKSQSLYHRKDGPAPDPGIQGFTPGGQLIVGAFDPCAPPPPTSPNDGSTQGLQPPTPLTNVTFIRPDGTTCTGYGSTPVVVTDADHEVAAGTRTAPYWRDGKTTDGKSVRVEVTQGNATGSALVQSQPLDGVESSLESLAWLLVFVSLLGIGGAATAGLLVARAALRPVDRLTEAVEHVARTEDLTVRMPVEGDDEIARLSRSFNAMTAALEASRDEQKRLVDDAGHELRTPLTSLRTTIDLLIRSDESGRALPEGKRSALLTGARTQMRELTVLIADLLELSRPEQARGTEPTNPVAFDEVVARAVERVRPRGMTNGDTSVGITASVEPWRTRGDEAALERAVVNLLDNAVKFSPPGQTVDVVLRHGTLTVRDRGAGIPPEELPHVFERFWRSPSARAMPGSGLGLAIAARVVREAGGTVTLTAASDGPGTVARIVLPRES
jgi:two-component system sensor histidine kinase MprB